jgi:hypothetical protein
MTPPLPPELPKPKTWWARFWPWVAILGGLSLIALITGSSLFFLGKANELVKSMDFYQDALAIVRADPAVVAALGTPIQDGSILGGNYNQAAPQDGEMRIPLKGPKARGQLHLLPGGGKGQARYAVLHVAVEGSGQKIDLRAKVNEAR